MRKQTRHCAPGVLVIFHEQYAEWFRCLAAEAMVNADRCRSRWLSVQRNLECRTETSAKAFPFNSAMVEIDETFAKSRVRDQVRQTADSRKDQPAQMAETTKPTAAGSIPIPVSSISK